MDIFKQKLLSYILGSLIEEKTENGISAITMKLTNLWRSEELRLHKNAMS